MPLEAQTAGAAYSTWSPLGLPGYDGVRARRDLWAWALYLQLPRTLAKLGEWADGHGSPPSAAVVAIRWKVSPQGMGS